MALSQGQMRLIGVVLTIALLGGAVAIVFQQMKKPAQVLVVDTGLPAPPNQPAQAPAIGKPVNGVVVNGDGAPVSGVEVLLVPEGFMFYLDGPRAQNYPAVRTDAQGKFEFPHPSAWWDLVAMNESGLARFAREDLPADGKIVLRPWGRVEGVYLAGQSPQANQLLSLFQMTAGRAIATANPASPYRMVSPTGHVRSNKRATTDAQGHFVFERIPSGPAMIGQIVNMGGGLRSNNLANFDVRAGETTRLEIGGKGRPVIGRVTVEDNADPLPPINGTIEVMPNSVAAAARAFTPAANWASLTQDERQKQVDEWMSDKRQTPLQIAIAVRPDGSFRAEDIPEGAHSIRLYSYTVDATGSMEIAANATVPLAIPPIPGGRSDEPFEAGTITLKIRPRIKLNSPAPPIQAVKADGTALKLSDFRGKYVLLSMVYDYGTNTEPQAAELARMGVVADRSADDGIVMLAIVLPQRQLGGGQRLPDIPGWLTAAAEDSSKLDPAYANSLGAYLIDQQGIVLAEVAPYGSTAYGMVDKQLGIMNRRAPGVAVTIEQLKGADATREFAFKTIPTISKTDAGQDASFTIIDGRKAGFAGEVNILNDGLGPRHERDEALMMSFEPNNVEGRILADLGKTISVEAINTYAWYKDSHRWAQVYRVYASDGKAAGFNASPKIGVNPTTCGWTFLADVDTRNAPGGTYLRDDDRGQSGVNIHGEKGPIGNYRYVLFVTFASETHNSWGQEFWTEIDIVGK